MTDSEPSAETQVETPQPAAAEPPRRMPGFGELLPRFVVASDQNPRFQSLSLGGGWMVLMVYGSMGIPAAKAAHDRILARRAVFNDSDAMFFGMSMDPADRTERGLANSLPGLRYFWDFDRAVTRRLGLADDRTFTPKVFLVDRQLRVAAVEPLKRVDQILDRLETIVAAERLAQPDFGAPVLTVPRILEPDLCQALVAYYDRTGGQISGFMREVDGMTVAMLDDGTKRRRDVTIEDQDLRDRLNAAVGYRLTPLVRQAFCWTATRIERYIVACYAAEDAGFFKPHRDNTTPGTAHRRFAVSINLNDDYDGGDLRFPEFGMRTYRPPVGGATVFSCALLHEATPVTRGLRYATLPFLYDEQGKLQRNASQDKVVSVPVQA